MLAWIGEHYQLLSLLLSLVMIIVWIAYLQVYIGSFQRQKRFKILINRGYGRSLRSSCLVSNMSAESIYVQSMVATLESDTEHWECPLTDLASLEAQGSASHAGPGLPTRQGPLAAGSVRNMGSFRSLIDHVLENNTTNAIEPSWEVYETLKTLEIKVLAVYASEDLLVGAKRTFDFARDRGDIVLVAQTIMAQQIRRKRERRELTELLEQEL